MILHHNKTLLLKRSVLSRAEHQREAQHRYRLLSNWVKTLSDSSFYHDQDMQNKGLFSFIKGKIIFNLIQSLRRDRDVH